jgi:N-glycosidase YbiA
MHEAVLAKFTQHADPREILLGTGDAAIVEHTENDRYWGDGGDGSGRNRLGVILVRVREELRSVEERI